MTMQAEIAIPGMPVVTRSWERQGKEVPLEPLDGVWPTNILILDFWSPEL